MSEIQHAGVGHEERDVSIRAVLAWVAGIFALLTLSAIMTWPLMRFYETREAEESPKASPLAREYGPIEPPAPRLQIHPEADLAQLRASEQAILDTYAVIDRERGTVRIPIDRAMTLLAERRAGGAPQ
ncbi:MAG TPA: hypothetical protein VGR62_21775 [Candidatus Binatia bacterium]|jgi:hypothetical protein|nr:hypothetical protein [Candidatus Binatia bacterium]